jgi:hypothetical protein
VTLATEVTIADNTKTKEDPMTTTDPQATKRDNNLNPREGRLPLKLNGMNPAEFIKLAYGFGADLNGPGRYDLDDPVQTELRHIKGWIQMAERDASDARKS